MAYFGRSPKKPGSVPGAASGFPEQRRRVRVVGVVERLAASPKPTRPGRTVRAAKAVRAARSGRSAR